MNKKKKIKVEFVPLYQKCTYHQKDKKTGKCVNCNDTMKYKDGYYMIINDKTAYFVDTIK